MKTLIIVPEELLAVASSEDWIKGKLEATGFDMLRVIYQDTDDDGTRIYWQVEWAALVS